MHTTIKKFFASMSDTQFMGSYLVAYCIVFAMLMASCQALGAPKVVKALVLGVSMIVTILSFDEVEHRVRG